MADFFCVAFGIGTKNKQGQWLEVYYPVPMFRPRLTDIERLSQVLAYKGGAAVIELNQEKIVGLISSIEDQRQAQVLSVMANTSQPTVACLLETDASLTSIPGTYLKLHLLSHRHVKPNEINLSGIYEMLPNVAWTNHGAMDVDELADVQLRYRAEGRVLDVLGIDKFPKMTNYVVPSGVRIAHSARVRLGAYLGVGTTVMPEGAVNFNAGAMGPNMIEGRLSQGVTMDAHSDLGGSASTMGTLSGGGEILISLGKNCLLGANAGLGIPLGDRCTVEAGLYITAGTPVQVYDENKQFIKLVKARELAGQDDMLFIRNAQSGAVECRTNQKTIQLNAVLHTHN